jgi:hypothetical protein
MRGAWRAQPEGQRNPEHGSEPKRKEAFDGHRF